MVSLICISPLVWPVNGNTILEESRQWFRSFQTLMINDAIPFLCFIYELSRLPGSNIIWSSVILITNIILQFFLYKGIFSNMLLCNHYVQIYTPLSMFKLSMGHNIYILFPINYIQCNFQQSKLCFRDYLLTYWPIKYCIIFWMIHMESMRFFKLKWLTFFI